jgi:glycosyltransferase involved in cell wall biosynthesis
MIPIISIITPIHNSEKYLKKMISSVKNQTFHNWELILIDDDSSDKSKKIIKKNTNKRIRYYYNKKQLGAGLSRNVGVRGNSGLCFKTGQAYLSK